MKTMTMKTQIPAELSSLQNDVRPASIESKTGGVPLKVFTSAIMPVLSLCIIEYCSGQHMENGFHALSKFSYLIPASLARRDVFQGE